MTTPTTGAPAREALRVALIELLTTSGEHHQDAATPATLAAVADTRRHLAVLHGLADPAAHHALASDRHAALSSALGDIGKALLAIRHHHTHPLRLRAGLRVLTAVALAWLDTLPHEPDAHEPYDGTDAEPF